MKSIIVRESFEALHHWQWTDVEPALVSHKRFLRFAHRHRFQVTVQLEVDYGNRQVEFFEFQALLRVAFKQLGWATYETTGSTAELQLLGNSCEDLAEQLGRHLRKQHFKVRSVTIAEDGENAGCWEPDPAENPIIHHDHTCHCGTAKGIPPHETGMDGCIRRMVDAPIPLGNDQWLVKKDKVTWATLWQQRGYYRHPCGCWSC